MELRGALESHPRDFPLRGRLKNRIDLKKQKAAFFLISPFTVGLRLDVPLSPARRWENGFQEGLGPGGKEKEPHQ